MSVCISFQNLYYLRFVYIFAILNISSSFFPFFLFFTISISFFIHTRVQQYLLDCLTNRKMPVLSMVANYKAGSGEWTKEKLNKYTSRFQITNSNSNCMCMFHPFSVPFFLAFSSFVIWFIFFLFCYESLVSEVNIQSNNKLRKYEMNAMQCMHILHHTHCRHSSNSLKT